MSRNAPFLRHANSPACAFTRRQVTGAPHLLSGSCSSPLTFGLGFLQTPPHSDALALLLTVGSVYTWHGDFHPTRTVPCPAYTKEAQPRALARRLERVVRRAVVAATSRSPRNASFTALSLGNASATSGSNTTTLVSVAARTAYFPRSSGPKSERLYSGRSSSTGFVLVFFIDFPLPSRRQTSTDYANEVAFPGVGHHQEATYVGDTKCHEALLTKRVV